MRPRPTAVVLAGWFLLGATVTRVDAQAASPIRVGTFDSRALALAYYNTAAGNQKSNELQRQYAEAKKKRGKKAVAEIEARAQADQALRHQQVFSSGSLGALLALPEVRDALSEVAARTGVAIVVSRWEVAWLAEGVEAVDVTAELVAVFEPSDQVRSWIEQFR